MRNVNVAALAISLFAALPVGVDAHPFSVDQANDGAVRSYGFVIPGGGQVGQSFTPTFYSLDVVELQLNTQSIFGGAAFVQIHAETITGPILGVSLLVSIPSSSIQLRHFDFAIPVPLVPGSTYVIEVVATSGTCGVFTTGEGFNTYPGGTAFFMGEEQPNEDLWFREGSASALPVAETTWGRVKALYF